MAARRLLDETVSTPEAIVRVLEEAGIEFVFGMPGGRTVPIYSALYDHRSSIRSVLVREEGLAAVMAEVYGRLTGRPGVAMGQAAFMLTNAGMGIVEGYLAGSPMLVLSDLSVASPLPSTRPINRERAATAAGTRRRRSRVTQSRPSSRAIPRRRSRIRSSRSSTRSAASPARWPFSTTARRLRGPSARKQRRVSTPRTPISVGRIEAKTKRRLKQR